MDEDERQALVKEHNTLKHQSQALAGVSMGVLCGGATFFHFVEHFKWLDSFYFCTITLTTVGYGDIVPKTDAGKLFDMFYVLVGIGIIATFANILVKNAMVRRQLKQDRKGKTPKWTN